MVKGERVHKLLDGAQSKEHAKELELAERFKNRVIIIDANCSIKEECSRVNNVVLNFIKERGL